MLKFLRDAVWERAGGRCEVCGRPVNRRAWTGHIHHKRYRGHGRERLEDLELRCLQCHGAIHPEHRFRSRGEQQLTAQRRGKRGPRHLGLAPPSGTPTLQPGEPVPGFRTVKQVRPADLRRQLAALATHRQRRGIAEDGPCALCLTVGPRVRDHCHYCGAARGLLCPSCNATVAVLDGTGNTAYAKAAKLEAPAWRLSATRYLRGACACLEQRHTGQGIFTRAPHPGRITRRPAGT